MEKTVNYARVHAANNGALRAKIEFFKKSTAIILAVLFILTPLPPAFAADGATISGTTSTQEPTSPSGGLSKQVNTTANLNQTNSPSQLSSPDETSLGTTPETNSVNSSPVALNSNFNAATPPVSSAAAAADFFASKTLRDAANSNADSQSNANKSPTLSDFQTGVNTTGLITAQNPYKLQTKVDSESGAMTFSYPIETPMGTKGLQPSLALSYNSQNTEEGSAFGYGWDISGLLEISRVNKSGADQFYDNGFGSSTPDQWILKSSLSGELVAYDSNTGLASSLVDMLNKSGTPGCQTLQDKLGLKD